MQRFLFRSSQVGHPIGAEDGSSTIIPFTPSELSDYTNCFDPNRFLGYGGFGTVYGGTIFGREERNVNGLQVAVKVSRNAEEKVRNQWEAETKYLSAIRHPNIITLIGHCETVDKFYLVYPLMQNGSVMSKLQGNFAADCLAKLGHKIAADFQVWKGIPDALSLIVWADTCDLDWRTTLKVITGAACAVEELHGHSPPLIYRDLKPENILLDKGLTPKLADFGTVAAEGEYLKLGTVGYTDPVIMTNGGVGTKQNDIYSLGVVILQMIMKEKQVRLPGSSMPVHISDWATNSYNIKGDAVHEKLKRKGCSVNAAKAITKLGLDCVNNNILERPTIGQVLQRLAKLDGK